MRAGIVIVIVIRIEIIEFRNKIWSMTQYLTAIKKTESNMCPVQQSRRKTERQGEST